MEGITFFLYLVLASQAWHGVSKNKVSFVVP